MTLRILICDDSAMARKHLQRSLPSGWQAEVHFAVNGADALNQIEQSTFDLLFLDLNMPEMDGYQVLSYLCSRSVKPKTIVCSADIQSEALQRVKQLGALGFMKKPSTPEDVKALLIQHNLYHQGYVEAPTVAGSQSDPLNVVDYDDALREICNVAMGKAGANIAQVLGKFVELPVPRVRRLSNTDMDMLIAPSLNDPDLKVISQGFIGDGIHGEALLMLQEGSYTSMGELMGIADVSTPQGRLEVQMETANILFSSFLTGLSQQFNISFCQSHPVVLQSMHKHNFDSQTLAVEICYRLTDFQIVCDLLLLFPQSSIPRIENNLKYLVG